MTDLGLLWSERLWRGFSRPKMPAQGGRSDLSGAERMLLGTEGGRSDIGGRAERCSLDAAGIERRPTGEGLKWAAAQARFAGGYGRGGEIEGRERTEHSTLARI
jgi:hypothetical protein